MEEIIKYLGNFHPVVLHLPIGAFLFTFLLFISQKYLKSNFDPAVRMGLLFSFITSIITSIFGYILHLNGDYDSVLVDRHMWLAVATTILIGFVLYLHKKQKPYNHVLSSFVFATVLLTITGHNGGSLTHGKDYLKLPDFEKEISIVSYDSIHVFNQVISPILDSKCVKCHNTGKSKGNLMLSSIDKILLGGEKGQIIKSNSSVDSRLYTYLNLPIDDEMHMPPDGNSQLNDNEKELIKLWIDEGADFYNFRKMNDDNFSKEILSFLPKEIASVDPPNRNDLVRLIENEFRIERISTENNFIDIKYQGKSFKQSYLRLLSKVSDNIKRLDLSFVDLSSIDLSRVDNFENLTYLNLNNTKLTTKKIQKLDLDIQTLILSNNNFDVSVFDKFISNPTNERVFAYNTISDLDLTKEISANSNDKIYFGVSLDDFASNVPLKIPIITPTQTLFSSTVDIEVVSDITSPDYRYTIDGDEPDSLSNLYVGPIKIDRSSNLKFKAFKKGSRPSPVQEVFYRKIAAPITDFKLLSTTVEPYAAKNILSNNEVGSADFRDGTWNGFIKSDTRSGDMIAEFSLPEGVNEIGISSLTDYGAYILFPTKIELYDISLGNDELVYSKNISRKFTHL